MNVTNNLPNPSVPVIGPDGRISVVWWQFFLTLFTRTGGAQGSTPDDQTLAPDGSSGSAEILAQLQSLRDAVHMVPPPAPAVVTNDLAPPVITATATDDLSPPRAAETRQDDPNGRIEALEAAVHRLQIEIEATRKGPQL